MVDLARPRRRAAPVSAQAVIATRASASLLARALLVAGLVEQAAWGSRAPEPLQAPPATRNSKPFAFAQMVRVPGNGQLLRQQGRVDDVIFPHDSFAANQTDFKEASYVIDHKRFVEPYATRCMASTLLEDPDAVEPDFVLVRPNSETRIKATAPVASILSAGFNPRQSTVIFVHGFTQSYPETEWLRKARALFELHGLVGKQNLIIMDWGAASKGSYAQVAARASGMGSFLANFLMKLVDDLRTDRASIHLIGHSLGAHVAGFAGKRIRPRLGHITGLDAAGPCFGKFFSNSANDRLAPDDAHQVDVFHYDDGFLGLAGQIGQFDVYVNGGSSQPGATDNVNAMVQALVTMVFRRNRVLSESHTRSTEVATSQLSLTGCQQIAYECRDWSAFLAGECAECDDDNRQCFAMDFYFQHANRAEPAPLRQSLQHPKRLFIATSPSEPYCLHHFQVLIQFEPSPEIVNLARKHKWRVHLDLVNERNEHSNVIASNQLDSHLYSYLLLTEVQPARFVRANLQVRQHDNTLVMLREKQKSPARPYGQPPRVKSIQLSFMSNADPRLRRQFSSRLCPAGWREEQNSIEDSSSNALSDETAEWLVLAQC